MAPRSSTLAWKIPWMEEPGRLQSNRVTEGRTRLSDFTLTFHFRVLEKEMATHSSVFAWRIPGTGEPGGLPSMGSHRVGHDWSDLAAVAARSYTGERNGNPLLHSCLENSWTKEPGGLQCMGSQRIGHHWVSNTHTHTSYMAFLMARVVKNLHAMWETWVLSLVWEDPPEKGWYPLQYSFLENFMDRGALRATAHGVAKSQTQVSD